MAFDARLADIRELNRLFLTYLRVRARDGQACLGLSRRVVRCLCSTDPAELDRAAELPTALFRLNIDEAIDGAAFSVPECPTQQMHLSLALQILSSARHLARSHAFEARMFLHLSAAGVRQLRTMPLAHLPSLASSPDILSCAFADGGLTWPALIRDDEPDAARMMILIALQPDLKSAYSLPRRAAESGLRSFV